MLTDAQIAQLETALAISAPGQWKRGNTADALVTDDATLQMPGPYGPEAQAHYGGFVVAESMHANDQTFVILAHNWMRELLEEVRAARAYVKDSR